MKEDFIVPVSGLAAGKTCFSWHAGKEFFEGFDNEEIIDAGVSVSLEAEKSGREVSLDMSLEGSVTVLCDRCLGDLEIPVRERRLFKVGYGDGADEGLEEGGREVLVLPSSESVLDMSQTVYDYVCLAIPIQRTHPAGGCDPEVVRFLGQEKAEDVPSDSPFAALGDLFGKK